VMPILEGERIVGRLDPKLHRDRGVLEVRGLWWESGIKPTKVRFKRLQKALEALARFLGASYLASFCTSPSRPREPGACSISI